MVDTSRKTHDGILWLNEKTYIRMIRSQKFARNYNKYHSDHRKIDMN